MDAEFEDIEILEHDLKRNMINHEFMIMHGNDPTGVSIRLNECFYFIPKNVKRDPNEH